MKIKGLGAMIIAAIFFVAQGYAQSALISVIVRPDYVPSGETVHVQGTTPILQGWDGRGLMLMKTSDNAWVGSFSAMLGETIVMRISRGSYDKEALTNGNVPLGDQIITVTGNQVLHYKVKNWADKVAVNYSNLNTPTTSYVDIVPTPIPTFTRWRYHNEVAANGSISRNIKVMLPNGYEQNNDAKYSVLIVHNGFDVFDNGGGNRNWGLQAFIDQWNKENGDGWLVVAIDNTDMYSLDQYSAKQMEKYCEFVATEVKQFIVDNYRTKKGPENFVYAGKGMGGLAALIMGWKYGNEIGNVICMNPKLEFQENYYTYLKEITTSNPKSYYTKYYMDLDEEAIKQNFLPGYEKLLKHMQNRGMTYAWMYEEDNKQIARSWPDRFTKGWRYITKGY